MDCRNSEVRWVGGERSPRGASPDATLGEGDPGAVPAAPLQSPSSQGSRGSIGPPGGPARAPGPLWRSATSSHVWDQCYCLSAGQAPAPLICARHTFPPSQTGSGIRPSPLSTYPCRPGLPWGRSGATLRTPWYGIMQTAEMEGDLGRPPGGGGICMELKRSKTPVSWSSGCAQALGHHGRWLRAPWGWEERAHLWPTPAHTHSPTAALSTH